MKYIVKKSWFAVEEGQVLNETAFGDLLREDGYCPVQKWAIKQALDQGFIEPYEEKPKIVFEEVYEPLNQQFNIKIPAGAYKGETYKTISGALKLFFEYLHTIPGTPQQNIKNQFEAAHANARKLVLKDNEVSDE